MILLDHAPYVPFAHPRTRHAPGLSPLDPAEWTVRHADFEAQMAYRRRLLAEKPDAVLGALAEGEDPAIELLECLIAHLGEARPLTPAERFCPLTATGRLVAEDFCLLLPDAAAGEYRLVAAVLCFPSRWLLSEKLGQPLTIIHDPVPDYDGTLARRVNRVFETLRPECPLYRVNWLIHTLPELHLPVGAAEKCAGEAVSDGPFYLRTERQTLVRLPGTGAVAFGIKTSVTPIEALSADEAASLHAAVAEIPAESLAYRAGSFAMSDALDALAARAGQGGRSP